MAQPSRYERQKDFAADFGNETDHAGINAELDRASVSINGIRTNLALIQRDDGGLVQGIVTADSVDPDFADELSGNVASGVQGALDDAQASALAATLAANAAETARNTAAGSATSAATSASAAASSASSAALSAGNSTTKANESAASAATATASKDASAASATGAASSATNAAVAATNADLSASSAATSATNAANSATNAANAASNAEASAAASSSAYDDFDRRFLGAKAVNPSLDNDGQPLQTSALYWNTSANEMRLWNGTAWATVTSGIPNDAAVTQAKIAPNVAGTGPVFRATSTVPQPLSSGVTARLIFGAEPFDATGAFADNKFQPAVAGYYQINGRANMAGGGLTKVFVDIHKNGALHERGIQLDILNSAGVANLSCIACDTVHLNGTTDYVELFGHVTGTSPACTFASISGTLLRAG